MKNSDRQKQIVGTSALNIGVNLLIAAVKVIIGLAAKSMAVISEGVNNATDALSSLLTIVGAKLSTKHPDAKHPFGYGRIEYFTGLVIGGFIGYTGITLLIESVNGIIHPEEMSASVTMIIVVAVAAAVKLFLGLYTINMGKSTGCASLEAVGKEGRNDSAFSVLTIASSIIYLTAGLSLDAYVGGVFALIIIKCGADTLRDTASELLGTAGKSELAEALYRRIRACEGVVNAADLMLHNYGPDRYSGSVNIEIDSTKTVGEVYGFIHQLQLEIMHEMNVTMVFGIYAVNQSGEQMGELRNTAAEFVRSHEHVTSYHALYISPDGKIYCDLIVDYKLADWDALRDEFTDMMAQRFPGREIELTVETEYV